MSIPKHIKDNISMPVIGAPLFLVSGPDLVIAQCKSGIIGSFPASPARPTNIEIIHLVFLSMQLNIFLTCIKLYTAVILSLIFF